MDCPPQATSPVKLLVGLNLPTSNRITFLKAFWRYPMLSWESHWLSLCCLIREEQRKSRDPNFFSKFTHAHSVHWPSTSRMKSIALPLPKGTCARIRPLESPAYTWKPAGYIHSQQGWLDCDHTLLGILGFTHTTTHNQARMTWFDSWAV